MTEGNIWVETNVIQVRQDGLSVETTAYQTGETAVIEIVHKDGDDYSAATVELDVDRAKEIGETLIDAAEAAKRQQTSR